MLLSTNGSWALALKREHIVWAKSSGWLDGNRKTRGGSEGK